MNKDEAEEETERTSRSRSHQWLTNFHRDLLAGAFMGGVVHTIVAPIERAKLLLQTQESNLAIVAGRHRRFKGMFDCIFHTVREEGLLSLWRGNGSSVLRYYPSVALNFSLKVCFCILFVQYFFAVSLSGLVRLIQEMGDMVQTCGLLPEVTKKMLRLGDKIFEERNSGPYMH